MFEWIAEAWDAFLMLMISMLTSMRRVTSTAKAAAPLPALKLTYFDLKGLGQAIRNTLRYGEVEFEDERVSMDAWSELKDSMPFGQLPCLQVHPHGLTDESDILAQSKTILRYTAKLCRLYPSNPLHAAYIDQWCDLHTDFMAPLIVNMFPERGGYEYAGLDKTKHRQHLIEEHIPKYLKYIETDLLHDKWLGGMDRCSMADMCWYPTLMWLHDGTFDGVDASSFDDFPHIRKFLSDMANELDETISVKQEEDEEVDVKEDDEELTDDESKKKM